MRIKLLVILFIGLCSNFAGAIKAEQKEICTYSQPSDFGSCNKKNNLKIIPKYPVSTFDWNGAMWIDSLDFFLENWENAGTIFNIIELSAPNNDQIEIKIGQKKQSFWIMTYIAKKFISSKIIKIDSKNIISWQYEPSITTPTFRIYKFVLEYIDEYGDIQEIESFRSWIREGSSEDRINIIPNLLNNLSGLDNGAYRNINQIRTDKLKENEKRAVIIRSIIKTSEEDINKCIKADRIKFPDLMKEYTDLSKTINPLRSKLDLPPSSDLKPICN